MSKKHTYKLNLNLFWFEVLVGLKENNLYLNAITLLLLFLPVYIPKIQALKLAFNMYNIYIYIHWRSVEKVDFTQNYAISHPRETGMLCKVWYKSHGIGIGIGKSKKDHFQ